MKHTNDALPTTSLATVLFRLLQWRFGWTCVHNTNCCYTLIQNYWMTEEKWMSTSDNLDLVWRAMEAVFPLGWSEHEPREP